MNYKEAKEISNWHYKEPYSIYSIEDSEEDINELLNGYYYSVSDTNNNLIGYYCFGEAAKVPAGNKFGAYNLIDHTDIGLGINPDLCGKRLLKYMSGQALKKSLFLREYRSLEKLNSWLWFYKKAYY